HHSTSAVNSAIPVIQSINRRIELIVAANSHHQILPWAKIVFRQVMDRENRSPTGCLKHALARPAGQMKPARLPNAKVVVVETRYDALDAISYTIVISYQTKPID